MKFLYLVLFLLLISEIQAQYGINVRYGQDNYSDLDKVIFPQNEDKVFSNSFEIGIDYWMRLKNYRIEFFPEFSFKTAKTDLNQYEIDYLQTTSLKFLGNTRIYPFDFIGDCDCPTFSKEGNWLTKGVFFYISPGLNWEKYKGSIETIDMNNFTWSLGTGMGLDIGLTDILTVSPSIGYRYNSNVNWQELADVIQAPEIDIKYTQIQFGVRLGIRFDYIENRRIR